MKFTLSLLIACIVLSCKSIRVVSLLPYETSIPSDNSIPAPDSINVSYGFWRNGGCFSFVVSNDRTRPIYMDLKKCVLFVNGSSRSYWDNKTTIITSETPYMNLYGQPMKINSSIVSNPERIVFIAPKSSYTITFKGLPIFEGHFRDEVETDTSIIRPGEPAIFRTITKRTFTIANSPVIIRNYLTFSDKENFNSEFIIESNWWANQILTVKRTKFLRYGAAHDSPNSSFFEHPFSYYYDYVPN